MFFRVLATDESGLCFWAGPGWTLGACPVYPLVIKSDDHTVHVEFTRHMPVTRVVCWVLLRCHVFYYRHNR